MLGLTINACQSEDCKFLGIRDVTEVYDSVTNTDGYRTDNLPEISRIQTVGEETIGGGSTLAGGDYFTLSSPQTDYYVWYDVDNTDTAPTGTTITGRTEVEVDISAGDNATTVATKTATTLNALADFIAFSVGDLVTIINTQTGNVTNIADGAAPADPDLPTGFTFTVSQQGVWYEVGLSNQDVNSDVKYAMVEFELPGITYTHQTFEASAATVANNQITLSDHGMVTGDQIAFESENSPATLPGGLSENRVYYVIRVDDNTFSVAENALNATMGIVISLTSAGSDTVTIKENVVDVISTLPNVTGTPVMLSSADLDYTTSTSLPNGRYRITYTIMGNGGGNDFSHSVTSEFLLYCQAKCCVYNKLANIPDKNCTCADNEIDDALKAWTYWQALKHAAQCNQADRVDNLKDLLDRYCDAERCNTCQ